MYVHDYLRHHALQSAGVIDPPCPPTPDPSVALRKNWSEQFVRLQKNRMCMGYYRYGSHVALGPKAEGCAYSCVDDAIERLRAYRRTGNQEELVDAANLCMIEFCTPTAHPRPSFLSTDDARHTTPL